MMVNKLPLYFVQFFNDYRPPLALGLVRASIRGDEDFDPERYELAPGYVGDPVELLQKMRRYQDGIFFFSDYIWNIDAHLAASHRIKERLPGSVVVHGGPSVPRAADECAEFLRSNPSIDFVCIGEGEGTAPDLLAALASGGEPSSVAGIAFLRDGGLVQGPPRERSRNLDTLPSPYLTGEFDRFLGSGPRSIATIETNRGCPYSCAFCDWGQATMQRVNRFSLERVKAEFAYAAERGVSVIELTDANFGILERDVEIAQFVAGLRSRLGYPREFHANYAKNAPARVTEIVRILRGGGLLSQATLSIQTYDQDVLADIKRSNIKTANYDALLRQFRSDDLPIQTEIMMALPGSTLESFVRDLQWASDRDLRAHISWTTVLPNTAMAAPDYIDRYAIRTADQSRFSDPAFLKQIGMQPLPPKVVIETNTFSELDFIRMARTSALFHLFYGESVLKYIMFYLRQAEIVPQLDFIGNLMDDDLRDYPQIAKLRDWKISFDTRQDLLLEMFENNDWPGFYDEIERYVRTRYHPADSGTFMAVSRTQRFVMAYRGRAAREGLDLEHDVAQWIRDTLDEGTARPLERYGPARLVVEDPTRLCAPDDGPLLYEPHAGALEMVSALSSFARSRAGAVGRPPAAAEKNFEVN